MSDTTWTRSGVLVHISRVSRRLWAWEVRTDTNSHGGFTRTRWGAKRAIRGLNVSGLPRKDTTA